jgi:hypothetical protein
MFAMYLLSFRLILLDIHHNLAYTIHLSDSPPLKALDGSNALWALVLLVVTGTRDVVSAISPQFVDDC